MSSILWVIKFQSRPKSINAREGNSSGRGREGGGAPHTSSPSARPSHPNPGMGGGVGGAWGSQVVSAGGERMRAPLDASHSTCSPVGGRTDTGTYGRMEQCHGEAKPPLHPVLSPGQRGDPSVPSAHQHALLSPCCHILRQEGCCWHPQPCRTCGLGCHRVTAGNGDSRHRGCPRGGTTSSCSQCPEDSPCTSTGLSTVHWCPAPWPSTRYWVPVPGIGSQCHIPCPITVPVPSADATAGS